MDGGQMHRFEQEYKVRAKRGAALLDEVDSKWWEKIQVDDLHMDSCYRCVIGQLLGSYSYRNQLRAALRLTPAYDYEWDYAHGFAIPTMELDECEENGDPDAWALLTQCWVEEIEQRRA